MTQDEWLKIGIEEGFCSPPYCDTHDGVVMTEGELVEFDKGVDACIHAVRLFELG